MTTRSRLLLGINIMLRSIAEPRVAGSNFMERHTSFNRPTPGSLACFLDLNTEASFHFFLIFLRSPLTP